MTNGDKIRAMTDKELSVKIYNIVSEDCNQCPVLEVCDDDDGKTCEQEIEDWLKRNTDK